VELLLERVLINKTLVDALYVFIQFSRLRVKLQPSDIYCYRARVKKMWISSLL
jgi:hypothetical protein